MENITVRVTELQLKELDALAVRIKNDRSFLIREGIDALLEYVRRSGGKVALPIDFNDQITVTAKSVKRGQQKANPCGQKVA